MKRQQRCILLDSLINRKALALWFYYYSPGHQSQLWSMIAFLLKRLCSSHTQPPAHPDFLFIKVIPILELYGISCGISLILSPSLFSFLTHFVSRTPIFRRSLFVLCCPSRKPVACILSSKHRTPLCSAVFKVLIKSWIAPEWDS